MKIFVTKAMVLMILGSMSFLSHAGFLDEIDASYVVKGKNCVFEPSTKLTGRAKIDSHESGATVRLEVIIGRYKTEIPVSFRSGKGDEKKTTMEGDIIRLPVTRRVVWKTDELKRSSMITEYEGVGVAKETGTYSLMEISRDQLQLKLSSKNQRIECDLVRAY